MTLEIFWFIAWLDLGGEEETMKKMRFLPLLPSSPFLPPLLHVSVSKSPSLILMDR